jgi:hypothetical protein
MSLMAPTTEDAEVYARLFARGVVTMESVQRDIESDEEDAWYMRFRLTDKVTSQRARHRIMAGEGLTHDEYVEAFVS